MTLSMTLFFTQTHDSRRFSLTNFLKLKIPTKSEGFKNAVKAFRSLSSRNRFSVYRFQCR